MKRFRGASRVIEKTSARQFPFKIKSMNNALTSIIFIFMERLFQPFHKMKMDWQRAVLGFLVLRIKLIRDFQIG